METSTIFILILAGLLVTIHILRRRDEHKERERDIYLREYRKRHINKKK